MCAGVSRGHRIWLLWRRFTTAYRTEMWISHSRAQTRGGGHEPVPPHEPWGPIEAGAPLEAAEGRYERVLNM